MLYNKHYYTVCIIYHIAAVCIFRAPSIDQDKIFADGQECSQFSTKILLSSELLCNNFSWLIDHLRKLRKLRTAKIPGYTVVGIYYDRRSQMQGSKV